MLEANQEAVRVFDYVCGFLGQNLELPSCLPWIFKTLDVVDEQETLEKVLILLEVFRQKQIDLSKKYG